MNPGCERCRARRKLVCALFALLLPGLLAAAEMPADEQWLDEDGEWDIAGVNEGPLKFLVPAPAGPVLHSDTRLRLNADKLHNGWVDLRQCYRNLDAVSKTEVVYAYRDMQNLRVTRAENIERYRTGPRSVALEGVARGALLCLQARVRVLRRLPGGRYGMRHGPYHRRFLDGYYPYHLSLSVSYPPQAIRFARIQPQPQSGFEVNNVPGSLSIETWFEGELTIELEFVEN